MKMKYFATTDTRKAEITIDSAAVSFDGILKKIDMQTTGDCRLYSLLVDNQSSDVYVQKLDRGYCVRLNGRKFTVNLEDEKQRFIRSLIKTEDEEAGRKEIKAPMPGLIVKLYITEGQTVQKGDPLVVIEAMKMENEIRATVTGIVKKIFAMEGDSVEKESVLMITE